jgi:hypothetical protein
MFWDRPSFRLAAIILVIGLMDLQVHQAEAISFSYYSYSSASFNGDAGGFSTSGTVVTGANYLNASGRTGEAKASREFSGIMPPYKIAFQVDVTLHLNGSAPLEFAYVRFGSTPNQEVRLFRSISGKLAVQLNTSAISETGKGLGANRWQSITVLYDPSAPKIEIDLNGSQAYSSAGPSSFLNGSVVINLGVLEVSSRKSAGEVLLDNFAISLSPLVDSDMFMYSPGDKVSILGHQFSSSTIQLTVKDPGGSTIRSTTVIADDNGFFASSFNLSSSASGGKYEISATDVAYGQVKAYFGVWKPSKTTVQRTESFTFAGGGARGSSSLAIWEYKGSTRIQILTLTAASDGSYSIPVAFSAGADLGSYSFTLKGAATADYPYRSFSDTLTMNVTQATLNVKITTDKSAYNRTQSMGVSAQITYPDGSTIPVSSPISLNLYLGRTLVINKQMTYSTGNMWTSSYLFSFSASLGNYTINIVASDAYGNRGSSNLSVRVQPATLSLTIYGLKGNYQRTETINISAAIAYPDGSPVTSGSFEMHLSSGNTLRRKTMQYDTDRGLWIIPKNAPYVIPADEATGPWTLTVVGSDLQNNPGDESSAITIDRAKISVLGAAVNDTYPRTSRIALKVSALYPSGSALSTGRVLAVLSLSTGQKYNFPLDPTGGPNWVGEVVLGRDFAVGYATLNLTASDQYLNSGTWASGFNITLATLRVNISPEKEDIQIGFDSITLLGNITYPDGSQLTSGAVLATITSGNAQVHSLNLTYSEGVGWKAVYSPSIFDPSGTYYIDITASDAYGNSGQASLSVNASQTLLITAIGLVLLAVTIGLVLWIRSRRASMPPSSTIGPELGYGCPPPSLP